MKSTYINGLLYHTVPFGDFRKIEDILPDKKEFSDIVLHWSGGSYSTIHTHYQNCITNREFFIADKTHMYNWSKHSHVWKRNTGKIAVSFMALANNNFPINDEMIVACVNLLDIYRQKYRLTDTSFVKDHFFYAQADGYTNLRWDIRLNGNFGGKQQTLYDYILFLLKNRIKEYSDVSKNHYYYNSLMFVVDRGLLPSSIVNSQRFEPTKPITMSEVSELFTKLRYKMSSIGNTVTRGNFMQLLYDNIRHLNISSLSNDVIYSDVDGNHKYFMAIRFLTKMNVITGVKSATGGFNFLPESELTRAEFVVIIDRLFKRVS